MNQKPGCINLKEVLKNPSHGQCNPDAVLALSWLDRRDHGYPEYP
jgi:hypothetical protein